MTASVHKFLHPALLFTFGLFALATTFSIALAQTCLGLSLILFLVLAIADSHRPWTGALKVVYIAIAAYICWEVLASLLGPTPIGSLQTVREEWLFVAVPIGIYLLRDRSRRDGILTALAVGVVFLSLYGYLQHFFGIELYRSESLLPAGGFGWQARGTFTNRNTYSIFFATSSTLFMSLAFWPALDIASWRRRLYGAAGGLAALAVFFSYTRGALVALAVAALIGAAMLGRRLAVAAAAAAALAAVAVWLFMPGLVGRIGETASKDIDLNRPAGRLFIWSQSLKMAAEHPVLGIGPGNFNEVYAAQLDPDVPPSRHVGGAHNDLLHIAVKAGIPATLIFLALWLTLARRLAGGWRRWIQSDPNRAGFCFAAGVSSLCFFLTSLFDTSFHDEETRMLLMIVWSVGLWAWYGAPSENPSPAQSS